jgi:thiamine transport system permease protein
MRLAGLLALGVLGLLCFGTVAVVAWQAEGAGPLGPADWRALGFTLRQASLSALLSVGLALPVARALSRRRFPGRRWLLSLLGAPFLLPAIVAILGVLAVWGRSGWVSDGLGALGLAPLDIYGMPGVLLAHVMLNLPLAARLLLAEYAAVPAERWRLAAQLGVTGWALFRLLEWPAIRRAAPGAAALVFAVCATSFAIALALGGGPAATTLELAIYEATLFAFDLGRAARLAVLQFALCAAAALAALALVPRAAGGFGVATTVERWDGRGAASRAGDAAAIALAVLFLGLPLLAVVLRGVPALGALPQAVWAAAGRSLGVAVVSMALTLAIALPLPALVRTARGRWGALAQAVGLSPLAASPFVVGVGLFIALNPLIAPQRLALPLVAVINAAMAVPYGLRLLISAMEMAHRARGPLADSLGLAGWTRARVLYWPALRGPLGLAAGLAAALSAGDLGVVALFSTPDAPTLPLLMHQLAGSRRIEAAYAAALVLVALSFGLFAALDRLGRA